MTKNELEIKVESLEKEIAEMRQTFKDVEFTTEVYEMSALRHAALLHELGRILNADTFSALLKEQIQNNSNLKPATDAKALEIIKEKITKQSGEIYDEIEFFKGEKRGVYGCIGRYNSIYGGYVCAIYRVSAKNKSAELAYRQSNVPTKDTALLCMEKLMETANEDRYRFSLYFDDDFKEDVVGHGDILFRGEILEMYQAPKGYYAVITFGGMNLREPFTVNVFRERHYTMEELGLEKYSSLEEARRYISDVVDEGLSYLRMAAMDW